MAAFHTLGVISDTHDDVEAIQCALKIFEEFGVERIIHCGDVTSTEVLGYFRGIPTDFALGNCDQIRRNDLIQEIESIGATWHEIEGKIEWRNKRVYFTHGDRNDLLDAAKYSGEWDLVCFGHTHQFENELYENTRVLNPGTLQSGSCCVVNSNLAVMRLNAFTGRIV